MTNFCDNHSVGSFIKATLLIIALIEVGIDTRHLSGFNIALKNLGSEFPASTKSVAAIQLPV